MSVLLLESKLEKNLAQASQLMFCCCLKYVKASPAIWTYWDNPMGQPMAASMPRSSEAAGMRRTFPSRLLKFLRIKKARQAQAENEGLTGDFAPETRERMSVETTKSEHSGVGATAGWSATVKWSKLARPRCVSYLLCVASRIFDLECSGVS